jgi:quercetin dioxygenase-like cupin family protein
MRIIDCGPQEAREVANFDSRGLRAVGLIRGDALAVTVLHLAAGGLIGRHSAVADQLFVVVTGSGQTCGGDGVWQPITAGQAALWSAGEAHSTRAEEPLTAVVIEAP